jgi:hypothetical protein
MIRAETETDWLLVTHPDHADLAGQFADAWGNAQFAQPECYQPIRYAVYHHDDGWLKRDAAPHLTAQLKPEAFTKDLVGAYSAFEEIDLPAYLGVRAQATADVAAVDPVAAVVVSMHTVNLLTEQADVASIRPEHRSAHREFIAEQKAWQTSTISAHGVDPAAMQRGFEFLQCCDNLSLIACSGYGEARALRHPQPDRTGKRHALRCEPTGPGSWRISPWPFATSAFTLTVPRRRIPKTAVTSLPSFRDCFGATEPEQVSLKFAAS